MFVRESARVSMINLVRKYSLVTQPMISLLLMVAAGVYINLLTTSLAAPKSGGVLNAVRELGFSNSLLVISLVLLFAQVFLTLPRTKLSNDSKRRLVEGLLELGAKSLISQDNGKHIRGIVTICNHKTKVRETKYTYNVDLDPERTATFPIGFGVTGEACITRKAIVKELPANHHEQYDVGVRPLIYADLRTILAVPLFDPENPQGDVLGVLAFDSSELLSTLGFDKRDLMVATQRLADSIAQVLVL